MSSQINLFDPRLRPPRQLFSAAVMAAALSILFLALVIVYGAAQYKTSQLQKEMAHSTGELASAQTSLAQLAARLPVGPQGQPDRPRAVRAAAALDAARDGYASYLEMFARHRLPGVSITSIAIAGADHEMIIRGKAASAALVPRYLRELAKEKLMHGASFAVLDLHRPQTDPAPPAMRAPHVVFELRTTTGARTQ
ncbi:MAG: hypothetical protein M0T84_02480 [Betaproteobacteria bacterium]|nr:hypothetical protein [Betaproteobacteria bacterium]